MEDERLTLDRGAAWLGEWSARRLGASRQAPCRTDLLRPVSASSVTASIGEASHLGSIRGETPAPKSKACTKHAMAEICARSRRWAPLNPREAAALAANGDILRPFAQRDGRQCGDDRRRWPALAGHPPRRSRRQCASGDGWIGIERNGAYVVRAAQSTPLGPGVAWAMLGVLLLMWGWRRETR